MMGDDYIPLKIRETAHLLCPEPGTVYRDASNAVNPEHYKKSPSGIECIQVTEHQNFCIGNAMKYLWRAGLKNDTIEDLLKARWYIEREIQRLKKAREKDV